MAKAATKKPSLTERLLKNTTLKEHTTTLDRSTLHIDKKLYQTPVPIMNVGLSGTLDGGLGAGLGQIAGPSKHFKTLFGLIMVSAYLREHDDAVCLFYDSEFGAGKSYFASLGIDPARVIHCPITDIEQLKFDVMQQINEIQRNDNVIVFIDSIGNLASKKEVEDALDKKSVADMTRAKQLKSLWRMVTPHLTIRSIPMIFVNHTYETQEMYSQTVVGGGTGGIYSSDWIWVVGRSKEKEKKSDKHISGYSFNVRVQKSRYVKEDSKFSVSVSFDRGMNIWSGLLDLAEELGYVASKVSKSKVFQRVGIDDDETWFTQRKTDSKEFWNPVFATDFPEAVRKKYQLATTELIHTDEEIVGDDDDE